MGVKRADLSSSRGPSSEAVESCFVRQAAELLQPDFKVTSFGFPTLPLTLLHPSNNIPRSSRTVRLNPACSASHMVHALSLIVSPYRRNLYLRKSSSLLLLFLLCWNPHNPSNHNAPHNREYLPSEVDQRKELLPDEETSKNRMGERGRPGKNAVPA